VRRAAIAVVVLGVLAAGFLAGIWYSQRAGVSASALRARRVLYYVDPMHPGYRSDKPGIAPDCGMPLEAIYDDGDGHVPTRAPLPTKTSAAIALDPAKQALIGVQVRAVEHASRTERLHLYGRVVADETRSYRINVGIDGYIRDMPPVTTGSRVVKDQWLATVSAPDVRTAVQAYLVSLDIVDRSRKTGDNQIQLDIAAAGAQQAIDRLLTIGMSPVQLDEVKRTRLVPPNIRITSPAGGFVVVRNASIGQKVSNGDELYRIADLGRVWVMADAFGADVDYVAPGSPASVSIASRATSLPARVSREVAPQFDRDSQSATIRLEVDNPSAVLRPDMLVDVDVAAILRPAITVPADAIVDSGLRRTVYVERGAGIFEPRDVETGRRSAGRVEIVKGLAAGERIVVAGSFVVDAERRLRTSPADDRSRP
jgi:membrane fusion protein, copper/silver efflux system